MSQAKVLLVDDEVEFATTLAERLRLRNYDTKAIFQPENVLNIIRDDHPDVVLLDLKMPRINGIEILNAIKQIDPTVEVIILSGQGDEQTIDMGMRNGASDYVVKPVDIEEITTRINRAKRKRQTE
jgi:DNA-binding response OmpR family regulator